jgi:hypothetical protein
MLNFQLAVKPQTEQRLKKILNQIQDAEIFAQGFIHYQISELQKSNLNIKLDLKEFEIKYKMTSETFYKNFTQGGLDDAEDFMIWSGLYEMFCQNKNQLNELA